MYENLQIKYRFNVYEFIQSCILYLFLWDYIISVHFSWLNYGWIYQAVREALMNYTLY